MKKPDPRPHQQRKTRIEAYRFSAGRAAATRQEREGTKRATAKLPTTLEELNALKAKQ